MTWQLQPMRVEVVHPIYSAGESLQYNLAHGEYDPRGFQLTLTGDQRPSHTLDEFLTQDCMNRKYKFKEIPCAATAERETLEVVKKLESLQSNRSVAQWTQWTKEFSEKYPPAPALVAA